MKLKMSLVSIRKTKDIFLFNFKIRSDSKSNPRPSFDVKICVLLIN